MSLPNGWQLRPLSEVADVRLGRQRAPHNHTGDSMRPYLRAANVTWNGLALDDVMTMNFTDAEMDTYRLLPGDLLLSEASGSPGEVGKPALWSGEIEECAFQNTLLRVRAYQSEPRYLLHYFRFQALTGRFVPESRGVGINHVGRARLAQWLTPIPPVDEQRRIVEILEGHLCRLDAADRALESAVTRLDALQESTVSNAPELVDASMRSLAELLSDPLINGRSVPTADEGFPVLRLTAMRNGHVDLNERKTGRWEAPTAAPFLVARDDVFVARGSGSLKLVGRAARVIDEPGPVAFPDTMIRARLNPGRMRSDYLTLVWNSRVVRRQIERAARTTAGIYKVNQKDLLGIKLPWIPVDAQTALVARVERMLDAAGPLSSSTSIAQRRSASLRRSLLAAAFSGRLTSPAVTQVPDQDVNAHFTTVEEVI